MCSFFFISVNRTNEMNEQNLKARSMWNGHIVFGTHFPLTAEFWIAWPWPNRIDFYTHTHTKTLKLFWIKNGSTHLLWQLFNIFRRKYAVCFTRMTMENEIKNKPIDGTNLKWKIAKSHSLAPFELMDSFHFGPTQMSFALCWNDWRDEMIVPHIFILIAVSLFEQIFSTSHTVHAAFVCWFTVALTFLFINWKCLFFLAPIQWIFGNDFIEWPFREMRHGTIRTVRVWLRVICWNSKKFRFHRTQISVSLLFCLSLAEACPKMNE